MAIHILLAGKTLEGFVCVLPTKFLHKLSPLDTIFFLNVFLFKNLNLHGCLGY